MNCKVKASLQALAIVLGIASFMALSFGLISLLEHFFGIEGAAWIMGGLMATGIFGVLFKVFYDECVKCQKPKVYKKAKRKIRR